MRKLVPMSAILSVLADVPEGQTTRQVAERLGCPMLDTISGRLAKMNSYGLIDRTFVPRPNGMAGKRISLWMPKVREVPHVQD